MLKSKDWVIRERCPAEVEKELAAYPEILRQLMFSRGVRTKADAAALFDLNYDQALHDPFLLKDMIKAVARILHAVRRDERILIFADYDADGVLAAAVLTLFFQKIGFTDFAVYLPDRHNEDHGLNSAVIKKYAAEGYQLIITVDCGISNVAEVAEAKNLGLDVIITDHHLPPAALPPADAIINPKQPGDLYPNKMLAGTGVVFKLVQALVRQFDETQVDGKKIGEQWQKWLLDLVAIATVADMVPLVGENRALVYFGLKILRQSPRAGLVALFQALKLDTRFLSEDDIGFLIGPRLNSASRMSHASQAYQLLVTTDDIEATTLAKHLEAKNKERRVVVETMLAAATALVNPDRPVLVVGDPSWSLGVLGLAAAKLVETYHRPVFVWGKNGNGLIKGSCRSDGSVDVVELLTAAGQDNFFTNFGGHLMAGGFSLTEEKLPSLAARLVTAYLAVAREATINVHQADYTLSLDEVGADLYQLVEKLSPYGNGYPKPLFFFPRATVAGSRHFGATKNHLAVDFSQTTGKKLPAVSFFKVFEELSLSPGTVLDLLATVEKSFFRGRPELRLRIVDLRLPS